VTSFHQCGGNVGDTCDIPLPAFVTSQGDIWYKDQHGHEDKEYISLFADNVTIEGRTPLQMYSDWFNALSASFAADLGSVIEEIQVGMGPAGELRYPVPCREIEELSSGLSAFSVEVLWCRCLSMLRCQCSQKPFQRRKECRTC